jgi:hypothetical protein
LTFDVISDTAAGSSYDLGGDNNCIYFIPALEFGRAIALINTGELLKLNGLTPVIGKG